MHGESTTAWHAPRILIPNAGNIPDRHSVLHTRDTAATHLEHHRCSASAILNLCVVLLATDAREGLGTWGVHALAR